MILLSDMLFVILIDKLGALPVLGEISNFYARQQNRGKIFRQEFASCFKSLPENPDF